MPVAPCCITWIALFAAFWLALAVIGQVAEWPSGRAGRGLSPRPDLSTGLAALLIWVYLRVFHRMKVEGRENLAAAVAALNGDQESGRKPRGVVVTANHAAGIDPLLLQAAVGGRSLSGGWRRPTPSRRRSNRLSTSQT